LSRPHIDHIARSAGAAFNYAFLSQNDVGEAAAAVPAAGASPVHQQDHALVRDLMEYFCFAVKANTKFRGTVLFTFQVWYYHTPQCAA
jgi:hypothetical protein